MSSVSPRINRDSTGIFARTILGAGHETTTTTMSWILLELASHPNVQAKLRAEILQAQAAAQTRNREPTLAEIDALPYFNAVIKVCK